MKFLGKSFAVVAMTLAVSTAAQARIIAPGDEAATGSEFLFNLVNFTKEKSYTLDLGFTVEQFLANVNQTLPSQAISFNVNNADFQQFLSFYSPTDDVKWGVAGSRLLLNEEADQPKYGFYTTSVTNAPAVIDENTADISNTVGKFDNLIKSIQTLDGNNVNNSTFRAKGEQGYTAGYGNDFQTALPFIAQGNVGDSLFFVREGVQTDYFTSEFSSYANKWTFTINGASGELKFAPEVAAVPLPAAVWMFGAGLMGFLGLNRRKSQAV